MPELNGIMGQDANITINKLAFALEQKA